jgi:hypothetical protein
MSGFESPSGPSQEAIDQVLRLRQQQASGTQASWSDWIENTLDGIDLVVDVADVVEAAGEALGAVAELAEGAGELLGGLLEGLGSLG